MIYIKIQNYSRNDKKHVIAIDVDSISITLKNTQFKYINKNMQYKNIRTEPTNIIVNNLI